MKIGKKNKFERLFTKHIVRKRIVPREFLEEYEMCINENIHKLSVRVASTENPYFIRVKEHEVFEIRAK